MPSTAQTLARRLGGSTAIALVVVLASGVANAQSLTADRIDAIERQIRNLQNQVQQLKGELERSRSSARQAREELRQAHEAAARAQQDAVTATAARNQAAEAAARTQAIAMAPPPPPVEPAKPGPKVVQTSGNRFGVESADGRNSIYLTGRLHFDMGDYIDFGAQSNFASTQKLNSGVNARRARLGITGKFAGDWDYSLIFDFGGSSDTGNPSAIQTAMVTYNGLKKLGAPVAFDIGYMDTPFTLQEATSSNDLLFVERASIQAIATSLFAGDFRSAVGARSNDDRYWVGVYGTGPTSGSPHTSPESFGAFGRAAYQVLQGEDYSVHLGGDVGALLKAPETGGIATVTLSDRPELRIDPTSILSTGSLGTAANPVTGAQVYGAEAAAAWRNLFLQSEYYTIDLDRRGLPGNSFDGFYVEGSWIASGERRKYNASAGAYTNPVPEYPFEPWSGHYGFGAWEVAARYSTVNLNSRFSSGLNVLGGVGGGRQTVYSAGLNWYPNTNIRFMLDYLHGNIAKNFSTAAGGGIAGTPIGTPIGGKFDAVVMRTQFAF